MTHEDDIVAVSSDEIKTKAKELGRALDRAGLESDTLGTLAMAALAASCGVHDKIPRNMLKRLIDDIYDGAGVPRDAEAEDSVKAFEFSSTAKVH